MAQYDDPSNPFSASSQRPAPGSAWQESAPGPAPSPERGGLQLPGEAAGAWSGDRPSPVARRRNQWRQHQQLTPDFGSTPGDAQPLPERPSARNASLPPFGRGLGQRAQPPSAPSPPISPSPERMATPAMPQRPISGGLPPLQMHPHSLAASEVPGPGEMGSPRGGLPAKVTPLRPSLRRPATVRSQPDSPTANRPSALDGTTEPLPPAEGSPARRSRPATARRRLANPPLPLLYLIRLIILGVGVAAIAGTLLSVLSPSNIASSQDGAPPSPPATGGRASGALIQGSAATVADLRLTSEITRLKGELEQLATLTPGLTPVGFAVDLDSGQYVDLGGAEPVAAASTIKVPILIAFLQQVDAGTLALNQSMLLQEEYMAGGSGTLRGEAVGNEYTALEVATRMIVTSDNTATNMMIAALGGIEALNQTFAVWGLEHTLLRNPLPDLDGTNTTSARDLALIMALVDQGGLLTPRSRDRLFSIMQRTENTSLIPSGIGDESVLANKTGDIGALLGDVALVDVPNGKRYTVALLVQRPSNDGRASELIRRMTETIHAEMAQPVAPVGNPNARPAPLDPAAPTGEFEGQDVITPPDALGVPREVVPLPDRAPVRDEIPPG